MMLDGGGSTQLVCNGQAYIDTTRVLPQAIGVAASVQGATEANAGMGTQPATPLESSPSGDQSAAAQAAALSSTVEAGPAAGSSLEGQALREGQPPIIPLTDAMAITDAGGQDTSKEAGPVGTLVDGSPVEQPVEFTESEQDTIVGGVNLTDPQGSSPDISLAASRLAQFAPTLSAGMVQNQAGFIPPNAYLPSPASTSQTGGFNPGDVLWLPALIPLLSIFILITVRRRNRFPQW
jgi:hypothetical protein